MAKKIPNGITIQEAGQYVFDLGLVLDQFHSEGMQEAGEICEGLGLGLESGQGSFGPIPFNIPQADGVYFLDAGIIAQQFNSPGFKAAGVILTELGSAVSIGSGSVGPIRFGSEGLTLAIANNELTGTIGPWQ